MAIKYRLTTEGSHQTRVKTCMGCGKDKRLPIHQDCGKKIHQQLHGKDPTSDSVRRARLKTYRRVYGNNPPNWMYT
jgi:hypothetical protein